MEAKIYDWNDDNVGALQDWREGLEFYDETLRDGLQSPSAADPSQEDKEYVLYLMDKVGIQHADIGLPGAGHRAVADTTRLAEYARDNKLKINLTCAARTHPEDIRPVLEISQKVGVPIEVTAFLGCSPIRQLTEGWDLDRMCGFTRDAIRMVVDEGLPCSFVTEDTIRSDPKTLRALFEVALGEGASGLIICDTVGHGTPSGVRKLITYVRKTINYLGYPDTVIDWHGHNDRGLGLINAITAAQWGAKRIHGTILGVGERVGNTAIDQLLVNLRLMGVKWEGDLHALREYAEHGAEAMGTTPPFNYPVFGKDAFRTATGVHAAAIIKALAMDDVDLADRVYSGIPAHQFGLKQIIDVGHMGGRSNVIYWLQSRGYEADTGLVSAIFDHAKATDHVLTEDEVTAVIGAFYGDDSPRMVDPSSSPVAF